MRALFFTSGSPFARAVRIVLDELELHYERREETLLSSVADRALASPTLQVPVLWDGDVQLWESSLIVEYLLKTYSNRPDQMPPLARDLWRPAHEWRDKLVFATIETLGSAITTISQLTWTGVVVADNEHLRRSSARIDHILSWLEGEAAQDSGGFLPDCLSVQDIFFACSIGFLQNRPLGVNPRIEDHPRLSALLAQLQERPSFKANPIWWWEPGIVGYRGDGTPVWETS